MEKTLAIRYIIYRVAQEFNKFHNKDVNDTAFFNEKNNFTLEKCLLLPYIITIANGNKNFFLNGIFKELFFPVLLQEDKKVVVGKINENIFIPYSAADLGLEFNSNKLVFNFNDAEFDFSDDLEKEDPKQQLKHNINYSIKFFIERRYKDFAVLYEDVLKKITYQNSAYDLMYNFFKEKSISSQILVKYFNAIAIESFYFTYYNEKIEEDVVMLSQI